MDFGLLADRLVQRRTAHRAQWQAPDGSSSGRTGQSSSACDPTRRRRRVHGLRLQHEGERSELREALRGAFRSCNSSKIHVAFINAENQVGPKGSQKLELSLQDPGNQNLQSKEQDRGLKLRQRINVFLFIYWDVIE